MDYNNILKGIGCLVAAFLYYKFFNKPLFDKRKENDLKKEGYSKSFIDNVKLANDARDFKGHIAGIGLIIVGIVLIYLGLTKK
jgi:hypothetical protein